MTTVKTVLVIDTAFAAINIGLYSTETGVIAQDLVRTDRGQAEMLVPKIQALLESSGLDYSAIDLIAVTVGPGSFTGLRVGIATARGFGLALNRPVQGVCTLDALAKTWRLDHGPADVNVVIDTRRDDVFHVRYSAKQDFIAEDDIVILSANEVQQISGNIIGDGVRIIGGTPMHDIPSITAISLCALDVTGNTSHPQHMKSEPLYARNAEVSQSKRVGRIPLDPLIVK